MSNKVNQLSGIDGAFKDCQHEGIPYEIGGKIEPPSRYNFSDIECIDVVEVFNYNMGCALKYIWRANYKGNPLEDLYKSKWYIEREIQRRENAN